MTFKELDEKHAECHRMLNNCDRMLARQREAHYRLLQRLCLVSFVVSLSIPFCATALGH